MISHTPKNTTNGCKKGVVQTIVFYISTSYIRMTDSEHIYKAVQRWKKGREAEESFYVPLARVVDVDGVVGFRRTLGPLPDDVPFDADAEEAAAPVGGIGPIICGNGGCINVIPGIPPPIAK
jgi:hypothetical protein